MIADAASREVERTAYRWAHPGYSKSQRFAFSWPEIRDQRQSGRARGAQDLDPIQGFTSGRSRPSLLPSCSSSTTAGGTSTRVASDGRTSEMLNLVEVLERGRVADGLSQESFPVEAPLR